ncbi:protein kinase [Streptomyces sp. NPDC086766]|uniref:protein kinase n=1 Tax=Streptomyces sp. NPDC086766 TaxID=3365754 RepID=UPI0037F7C5CD
MDDYAGRVLADRYRLPLPPSDEYELTETRAFDTYSGQEVLVRQVPLPEVVEAEVLDADGLPAGFTARDGSPRRSPARAATRRPTDPAVRRAVEAAQAAARIPDHPRLDQVFDVFAEGGSLWIVSELVAARPLAALLAERPLTPYRAAEVASDVVMALRVLHAHGWVHRNITARTVLVCDDGRVMLTGLAVGAAEEALCGYDPVPAPDLEADGDTGGAPDHVDHSDDSDHLGGSDRFGGSDRSGGSGRFGGGVRGPDGRQGLTGSRAGDAAGGGGFTAGDPEAARRAAIEARAAGGLPGTGTGAGADPARGGGSSGAVARRAVDSGGDVRAARAGAIAAYRAGARAAARVQEAQESTRAALPAARPPADGGALAGAPGEPPYAPGAPGEPRTGTTPPGRIADPYGVQPPPWGGARPGSGTYAPAHGAPAPGDPAPGSAPFAPRAGGGPYVPAPGTAPGPGGGSYPPAPGPGTAPRPGTAPAAGALGPGSPSGTAGPAAGALPVSGAPELASGAARTPGAAGAARWDDLVAGTAAARRGPATALAAERARQARMTVVGPVTERWAPEQAGPVHENWQLAAPIGPATDLWALGALLFRAVQGHAPYPEESTAELVQMVCAEPPAFAEECGPLRPVVESLLRQDPTERPDFEELRGWLRSLVRSAPEPDAGAHVVAAPPADPSRLPVVRRRGELVRRRRAGLPAPHGRHKRARQEARSPRSLGRTLLLLILLLLAAAVAYATLFLPKSGENGASGADRTSAAGDASPAPAPSGGDASGAPGDGPSSPGPGNSPSRSAGSAETQTTDPGVADGFALRKDAEGFQVAVADGWSRTPRNDRDQVVYSHGGFELIVVPGRDSAAEFGSDPMAYQREKETELRGYRDSSWATSSGMRTIQVGGRTMAEGQFTWTDANGRALFVRNLAILQDGRYHVVQVRGPESQKDQVTKLYEQASATYRFTG